MERRLAAILAGDVVGYSRLMAENETATYEKLRKVFDEIVGPFIGRHFGRIFKTTGDGFIASFDSANEALGAALEIQHAMEEHDLKLRMGLNLGDVIEENGDVFGDGVNIASRLEAMAEPGGIWASAALVRSADKAKGVRFQRIGHRKAKNIPDRVEVYAVLPAGRVPLWHGSLPGRAAVLAAALLALLGTGYWLMDKDWLSALADRLQGGAQTASLTEASLSQPVVAVLPFDNLSGDPAQGYFADGLTEDIITDLARNRDLMVIARNSTFAFKDRPMDIRAVGAELGAGYVVEGSARRSGDDLRVVAQLIDARTGSHLWSRSYDRQVKDVFEVQADLTSQIVASLASYVRQSEADAGTDRPTDNASAYDLVLRARSQFQHGSKSPERMLEARDLYQRAIALDPDYAAAHAYLGLTHIMDYLNEIAGTPKQQDLEMGLAEAREAIRLEPDLALGHQVLSYALASGGDYEGSLRAAQRAADLSPSDPDSLMALAKAQVRFGSYREAVANAQRARLLHPLAPAYYSYVHAQALYAADRPAEAESVLVDCLLDTPRQPDCLTIRTATLARLARLDEARESLAQLLGAKPGFSLASERLYRRFGDSPLMDRFLRELAAAGAPDVAAKAILR